MKILCDICPHLCSLDEGETGKCLVRRNTGKAVELLHYGECSRLALEPIEKRPFFHFYPAQKFLSVGFLGCSFACDFCLPGDTLILTPSGPKRIDQIDDGDEIIVFDDSAQQLVLARVGHVFDREVEEVIELEVDGQTIQLTPEHPILTRRGWVKAEDLTSDDEVLCDKIDSIQLHYQSQIAIEDM